MNDTTTELPWETVCSVMTMLNHRLEGRLAGILSFGSEPHLKAGKEWRLFQSRDAVSITATENKLQRKCMATRGLQRAIHTKVLWVSDLFFLCGKNFISPKI